MRKVKRNQYGGVVTKTINLPEVIVYGHKPSTFDKFLSWLKNATLGAAIAESPAVATASGWHIDSKTGKVSQHAPTESERQLGDNLFAIGETAITAPTLVSDISAVVNAVRHPIRTARTVRNIAEDIRWFRQHPGHSKVYHVNKKGETFNLQDARTASPSNIGIHVTPHEHISKTFNQNAPVMEAYIPRADMETIDIGANDYRLLSNDYVVDARPLNSLSYHDGAGNPQLYINLLKKYGAKPTRVGNKIYTENRAVIPLRDETWPNMPQQAKQQIDQIIEEGKKIDFSLTPQQWDQKATQLNQRANDILSNNGKKVIKYTNVNPSEVRSGDGVSFVVTDPSIFYNAKSTVQQRYMPLNLIKYPFTYGISRLNQQDQK